jgi:membrane fusion protein (multidrug efflux system)
MADDTVKKPKTKIITRVKVTITKKITVIKETVLRIARHPKTQAVKKQAVLLAHDVKGYIDSKPALKSRYDAGVVFVIAKKKRLIAAAVVLGVVLVVGNFVLPLFQGARAQRVRTVRADVFAVASAPYVDTLSSMGLVRGTASVDVGFQNAGVVSAINFTEGQMVKQGDVIATLDDTDARLKVEYNESKVKVAESRVTVHEQLFALKSIIQAKLDEVRYELESQKKELEFAQQELIKTRLAAPVGGLLGPIEVEKGELVNPNTKVTSVFGVQQVFVDLGVIEKDIGKIGLGKTVTLTVDAYPEDVRDGDIVSVSPVIEGKSRNFKVRVLVENPDSTILLLPGMFARANITVFKQEQAIVIPQTAIGTDDTVYVVRDGRAKAQKIRVGYRSYDYAAVAEGLQPGDKIIAELEGDYGDEPNVEIINERKYESDSKTATEDNAKK